MAVMTLVVIFQHRITFELLNHISKAQIFWNVPTCGQQVKIFYLFGFISKAVNLMII